MNKEYIHYLEQWKDCYCSTDKKSDPHTEFANAIGVDRDEAKMICYQIMFQIPFLTKILVDLKPKNIKRKK